MAKYTAVVTDYGFPDLKQEKNVLEPVGFEVIPGQCRTAGEVANLCRDADAVLTQWAPVTAEAIAGMSRCRIIVRYGIGVDNVDLEAAKFHGIPVVNVPDYAINEVADHAMSLLLASARKIVATHAQVRRGIWEIAPFRPILGLQESTLGLAGFGNIARAVAKRAQAFGLRVIAYDPFVKAEVYDTLQVEQVSWDTLIADSDLLSLHLPLTEQTRHLINAQVLHAMKPTAHLVNTSRGGVIDTDALAIALQNREIGGAGLDVLEIEPITPGHPLLQLDNCIVTSHCAWYSESALSRLQLYAALEVERVFAGQRPKHVINGL
ncbi:C-terminal binding protein [Paenibacillaceae bacterium]|nr:C-terminal binding protein [Paenibacillaceae bacterium]